jgi:putative tricarboxylic transport membrane protein
MRSLNANVVIALLLLVVCGVMFYDTFLYKLVPGAIIGSKIWPRIVTVALAILSAIYLVQSLRAEPVATAGDGAPFDFSAWLKLNRNVIGCFALYGLFLVSLEWLGMLIGGIVFVFVTLCFIGGMDRRNVVINAAVAVVLIGSMWSIFTFALGVILPTGVILSQ